VNVTTAPIFQFLIKNTGSVGLSTVVLEDAQLGNINIGSLGVGRNKTFNATGVFVPGLSNNFARVRGTWQQHNERVSASDVAWTKGAAASNPSLKLIKSVYNLTEFIVSGSRLPNY
jgi:hypothetical protein